MLRRNHNIKILMVVWQNLNPTTRWNQNEYPLRNEEFTVFTSFSSFSGNFCILFLLSDWKYKSKLFYWVMFGLFALRHFQNWNQNKNPSRNKEITEFLRFSSFSGNFCIFITLFDGKNMIFSHFWFIYNKTTPKLKSDRKSTKK